MKKILIVDDQPEVRELVEVTLRVGDFKILQAENGPKALKIARAEKPELILLDVMMPEGGMDGLEVCEQLKKDPETAGITIIMLTAKGQEIDKERGNQVGADDYFTKPFSPLKLINKVEEVLG
ncbi:MAG: response regulator [Candidatus Aminicenantes bacterium]|nr:response regulator [Candidatus Aminicenantes bacterium]